MQDKVKHVLKIHLLKQIIVTRPHIEIQCNKFTCPLVDCEVKSEVQAVARLPGRLCVGYALQVTTKTNFYDE